MTVEHHESAKNIKENILKNFREELGQLKEVVPQENSAKEKPVWTKIPTEAVKNVKNQIEGVVGKEKTKAEEEFVTKAKEGLKNYAVSPYSFNIESGVNALPIGETLAKIDAEFQKQFDHDIDLGFSGAYFG